MRNGAVAGLTSPYADSRRTGGPSSEGPSLLGVYALLGRAGRNQSLACAVKVFDRQPSAGYKGRYKGLGVDLGVLRAREESTR